LGKSRSIFECACVIVQFSGLNADAAIFTCAHREIISWHSLLPQPKTDQADTPERRRRDVFVNVDLFGYRLLDCHDHAASSASAFELFTLFDTAQRRR
jgi:hypothetical protein